jgi:glycosyltransferase involved in cell wall biosynthesis
LNVSICITYAGTPLQRPPDVGGNDPTARHRDPAVTPGPGRKPHICFVAPTAWPVIAGATHIPVVGGAEVQQGFIARALVARGYRVSMISLDYGQAEPSEVDGIRMFKAHRPDEGMPVVRFVHPRMTKMWRAMKRVDADIYYQRTSSVTTALMAVFCRHYRKRSIYAGASDMDFIPGHEEIELARDKWIFQFGLKRVDEVVVQHTGQQRNFRRNYGREATLIPSCYVPPAGARPDRSGYALWVARMGESKRPELLVEIARRMPGQRVVMVGGPEGGRAGEALHRAVREAAATVPNLDLLGFVPYAEIDRWFDGARIVINTSKFEGFPNTFLQAWARGIPTVSLLDTQSLEEGIPVSAIAQGVEDAAALARRLMTDDLAWQQASTRAQRHFRRVHSVDAMLVRYEHLLASLGTPR